MSSIRFPRAARVRARADFDRIFKQGRRVALPVLALHWQAGEVDARLGLAVSKKVDPHAVGRNRIKRVLRDTFRHRRAELAGGDYVVVARVGAARCSGNELRTTFIALLSRAGTLPAAVPLPLATHPMPVDPRVCLPVTSPSLDATPPARVG